MEKYRTVIAYGDCLDKFLSEQTQKVREKVLQILRVIETLERIPKNHLRYLQDELYEVRVIYCGNIFRILCFFDEGKLVILLNGFQKKTQKTPRKEIEKATALKAQYYKDKEELK